MNECMILTDSAQSQRSSKFTINLEIEGVIPSLARQCMHGVTLSLAG